MMTGMVRRETMTGIVGEERDEKFVVPNVCIRCKASNASICRGDVCATTAAPTSYACLHKVFAYFSGVLPSVDAILSP